MDAREIATNYVLGKGGHVLEAGCAQDKLAFFSPHRTWVLSDRKFYLFSKNGKTKRNSVRWQLLTVLDVQKQIANLSFGKIRFSLAFIDATTFLSTLSDCILRILLPTEVANIQLDQTLYSVPRATNLSVFTRFIDIVKSRKLNISEESTLKIKRDLEYGASDLDTADYKDANILVPVFLDLLMIHPTVNHLFLHPVPGLDIWDELIKFASGTCTSRIKMLSIDYPVSPKFHTFMSLYNPNELQCFSFINSNFGEDDLDVIQGYYIEHKTQALELHNAFSQGLEMDKFYNSFLTPSLMETLLILDLKGTPDLDIDILFSKINRVASLSLDSCGVEVTDTLIKALQLVPSLRILNLSRNPCTKPIPLIVLSQELKTIIVDQVDWEDQCFVAYLDMLMAQPNDFQLKLHCPRASCSCDEMERVFSLFGASNFSSILHFNWDGNPFDQRIARFLMHQPNIDTLNLCDCISDRDEDNFQALIQMLNSKPEKLMIFTIIGSDSHHLGRSLPEMLEACVDFKLQYFDFSNSQCGDDCIPAVAEFIEKTKSLNVVCDGMKPMRFSSFKKLLDVANVRAKLKLSFPDKDFDHLVRSGQIPAADIETIIRPFRKPSNSTKSKVFTKIPPLKDSYFEKEFRIFHSVLSDLVPHYLMPKKVEELRGVAPISPSGSISTLDRPTTKKPYTSDVFPTDQQFNSMKPSTISPIMASNNFFDEPKPKPQEPESKPEPEPGPEPSPPAKEKKAAVKKTVVKKVTAKKATTPQKAEEDNDAGKKAITPQKVEKDSVATDAVKDGEEEKPATPTGKKATPGKKTVVKKTVVKKSPAAAQKTVAAPTETDDQDIEKLPTTAKKTVVKKTVVKKAVVSPRKPKTATEPAPDALEEEVPKVPLTPKGTTAGKKVPLKKKAAAPAPKKVTEVVDAVEEPPKPKTTAVKKVPAKAVPKSPRKMVEKAPAGEEAPTETPKSPTTAKKTVTKTVVKKVPAKKPAAK